MSQKRSDRHSIAVLVILTAIVYVFVISAVVVMILMRNNHKRESDSDIYAQMGRENIKLMEEYDVSPSDLIFFQELRTIELLNRNGIKDYDEGPKGRHYNYDHTDYEKMFGLDETYLFGFYLLADDYSVDEMVKALGYNDFNDYLIKNNCVDENNDPDEIVWGYENTKIILPIYKESRSK